MSTVQRMTIANGDRGAIQTLHTMRKLIRESYSVPIVVETAHGIVTGIPARQFTMMGHAIRSWLDAWFRFVPDPVGNELLRTPEYQLRQMATGSITGDCDDAAILGAALAGVVGIPSVLRAVAFSPTANLSHVFTVLIPLGGAASLDLDITKPHQTTARVVRHVDVPV